MPTAYPYLRVSHGESAASGLSPEAQLERCRQYYLSRIAPTGVAFYTGDPFYDPAVSARHVPFLYRKRGAELGRLLKAGDHVIFAYLDRGFRAVLDFAALIDVWRSQHVTVHFADLGVDLSTGPGMLVANIMASVAQGQSDLYSERNKAIAARLRKMNRPTNGTKRLGYKLAGKGKHRYWVPDKVELGIMAEIVRQRDAGESFEWISRHIEKRMCELDGRIYKNSAFFKRQWTKQRCWRAYRAWQEIQAELER